MLASTRLVLLASTWMLVSIGGAPSEGGSNHCLSRARVSSVPGSSDRVLIETASGSRVVRYAPPLAPDTKAGATQVITIFARDTTWDADGNPGTIRDTITVIPGTAVRWQWVAGFHTITDGPGSSPQAGQLFDYVLDAAHPTFDTTLTTVGQLDFFCYIHEGTMHGVIKVAGPASVPPAGAAAAARFSRPPAPNPATGSMAFAISLPRAAEVELSVLDAAGRQTAVIHRGSLGAGEHAFGWDGRTSAGARAAAGVYLVRMRAGEASETRRFSYVP